MAKILIVDDSRTSRRILRSILEGNGHVIAEASNGEDGYLRFKEEAPDLVTLDITMPVMDGIEALQLIKKADPNAKVVMITAAGQKEKMITALKHGAKEFLTKPYEDNNVLEVVERVLAE